MFVCIVFAFQSKSESIFQLLGLLPGTAALPRPGKCVVAERTEEGALLGMDFTW
jgi:hypothetical protein